jgi:hypothetical protein
MSVGTSYNKVLTNSVNTNEVFNHRLSFNYSPKLKNQKAGRIGLNLSAIYMQKTKSTVNTNQFSEFTGNVGINYGF